MSQKNDRRQFLKRAALTGAGLGLTGGLGAMAGPAGSPLPDPVGVPTSFPTLVGPNSAGPGADPFPKLIRRDSRFIPHRAASWWTQLEDILWPEKKVVDRIRRRADGFSKNGIDTAVNFGFHIRFDFSNYFGQLHGYYNNVCEELHKRDIRFMDHYSCNHVERPRGEADVRKLHTFQRHHVLLYHDPVAAPFAQYEGHYFNDCCETDLRDGGRGYSEDYQLEVFCHNNPGYLDMHRKYLLRLMREVDFDGLEIDDMCDYAGLTTCGCKYCRERLKKDYGHEIPAFGEKSFWGDTRDSNPHSWGNYDNPAFRDWLRMKSDSVADHLKMIKDTIGNVPLMTCCSNAGPMVLNSIALNLEKMAPYLDFFMLENVGISVDTVSWMGMDAEAMYQKDVAAARDHAPAITISYMIYPKGGYLGWCLGRFWGVANWSSTLIHRLAEDPPDAVEVEDIIGPYNNWEIRNAHPGQTGASLQTRAQDLVEARLVTSLFCRDNGWRGDDGLEQWDRVKAWSLALVGQNMGYRLLRSNELSDSEALISQDPGTPLILDGVACVSDAQGLAVQHFLEKGGRVWMALPFGTHDGKGFKRTRPLSEQLHKHAHRNLVLVGTAAGGDPLGNLIREAKCKPVLKQLSGNPQWAVKMRIYEAGAVLHFLSTGLVAVPHPTIRDDYNTGHPVLQDFHPARMDNKLEYAIDTSRILLDGLTLKSPEMGDKTRPVVIRKDAQGQAIIEVDLQGIETYAVAEKIKMIG